MRKLFYIFIIMAFLGGVVVWEQISVVKYLNDISDIAQEIEILAMDNQNINTTLMLEKVEKLETIWLKHESILCMFANHKDMQDMAVEIAKMKANVAVNQYEDFHASLNVVIYYTDSYTHFMGVSFQNIL